MASELGVADSAPCLLSSLCLRSLVLLQDEIDRPGALHAPPLGQLWSQHPRRSLLGDLGPPHTWNLGPGLDTATSKRDGPIAIGERAEVVCRVPATLDLAVG